MRPDDKQGRLDLQPLFAPSRPGDVWAVGHYFASGKVVPTYYVFHLKTGRRALDAAGRRRKFKTQKAAFRAAKTLNTAVTPKQGFRR